MSSSYKNVIYTISFMDLFAVGLFVPLFGNHLKSLGASHFVVGLVGSVYSGIQIISGPIFGSWSDVGDRKTVLIISLILSAVCYSLLGFLSSIGTVVLIRVLIGVVKHTQGICKAMISDLFPSEKLAEMLSRSAALGTMGFIVGPVIGGYISELPNGFTYVCLLTSTFFFSNIVLASYLPSFKPKHRNEPTVQTEIKQELLKIGSNLKKVNIRENWDLFSMRLLFGIATSMYFHNQAIYMREYFNLNQVNIGYLISFIGIVQTCSVFSLGHINQIFYKHETDCSRRMFHFFSLMSCSSILLYFTDDIKLFLLFIIPFAISSSVLRISTMELLLGQCSKEQKGTFSGVSNSIASVAKFITPLISGLIIDFTSIHVSILLPSVPALLGSFVSLKVMSKMENIKKGH
ncbi:hypothetical protein HHI36_017823 [Cryptolaemus montrouzieri]|uniref:Major facilitator superfamily (MFS) profile domain-containing protein n=1 Tax=Cryptolaemus montrouzieri TaxID=559131 RepID=A0ABD2NP10_9CUCU